MNTFEEKLKDKIFEWFLEDFLNGQRKVLERPARGIRKRTTPSAPIRTDLKNIYLRYDDQAQLNLADVKPTGFLLKSNG